MKVSIQEKFLKVNDSDISAPALKLSVLWPRWWVVGGHLNNQLVLSLEAVSLYQFAILSLVIEPMQ